MRRSQPVSSHLALCLLLAFLAIPVAAEPLDELWPQWRGPSRDGQVTGADWPANLQCFEPAWRVELGKGYPGPIVARDRVFVAETEGENEIVRALDRATGKELWRASWAGTWKVPFFAARNGSWIRSTPAYDGESLFVGGIREVVVRLDAETGKEHWRVDFPARYGTEVPHFGFASSPLVVGDHVYVQAANSMVKLDKATGKTVWRSLASDGEISESGAFSSPVMANIDGQEQLLVQTRLTLHGLDPASGDVLWSHDVPNFRGMNILPPTVFRHAELGDTVFTSTHREGSFSYRVSKADDKFEVNEAWRHKAHGYMSSPVVVDGHAYLHLGNGRLTCLDLATGEERWTSQPFGKYWSTAVQGDKILALDAGGDLHLVKADPEKLELVDSRTIAEAETWGHVAVSGSQVFIRELEAIAAYNWCEKAPAPAPAAAP